MLRFAFVLALLLASDLAVAKPFEGLNLAGSSELKRAEWGDRMDKIARDLDARFDGNFAAYVSDLHRGVKWGYRDDQPYYLASGVKIAFMVEVFRQREFGELSFDEEITYTAADIRDGAPRVNKQRMGARISIRTLLDWMMRSSDNAASDMLAGRVTLSRINEGLRAEGLYEFSPHTRLIDVRRGVYRQLDVGADDLSPAEVRKIRWTRIWDPQIRKIEELLGRPRRSFTRNDLFAAYKRFYDTGVNRATMRGVGLLFEKMVRGELVSPKASEEMLELMSGARTSTHRLLGRLPRGTRVAHKTGSQYTKLCDLGVIYMPDGTPLVVTVCTEGGLVPKAENVVARIARAAYDIVKKDHQKTMAAKATR